MANLYSQAVYDNAMLLKAAGLVAASADGSVIIDTNNTDNGSFEGMMKGYLVLDVTAIEQDTGDEQFDIYLEMSNTANMSAGKVVGQHIVLGATTVSPADGANSAVGRYMLPFRNEMNGNLYRYLRIRTVVAGTIASGINYTAWLAKQETNA